MTATHPPSMPSGRERRGQHRAACRCRVLVHHSEGDTRGKTINVSAGGALIAIPRRLPLGVEIQLDMVFPDGDLIEGLRGLPVREENVDGHGPNRYGIHFIMPPEDVIQRLRKLLYQAAPA